MILIIQMIVWGLYATVMAGMVALLGMGLILALLFVGLLASGSEVKAHEQASGLPGRGPFHWLRHQAIRLGMQDIRIRRYGSIR